MTSVNAYFDGQNYIIQDNIDIKKNQRVIITLLDDYVSPKKKRTLKEIEAYMDGSSKSAPNAIATSEYVKQLRES